MGEATPVHEGEEPLPGEVTDLAELVRRISLASITFHEMGAVSNLGDQDQHAEKEGMTYELQTRKDGDSFGLRVRAFGRHPLGTMQVVVAADYANEGPPPSDELLAQFAPEVGFLAVFPYIRQAISYLSTNVLGEHLLLDIVRREDLTLTEDPPGTD